MIEFPVPYHEGVNRRDHRRSAKHDRTHTRFVLPLTGPYSSLPPRLHPPRRQSVEHLWLWWVERCAAYPFLLWLIAFGYLQGIDTPIYHRTRHDDYLGMDLRRNLYVSAFVAASLSYIFVMLTFNGQFSVIEWGVFAGVFLVILFGFEKFLELTDTLK